MNAQIKSVPHLRFSDFNEDWKVKELNEVADRITTKNKENNQNVLTISAQFGLISQLEFFNKSVSAKDVSGYYLLHEDDFVYNKSYSNGYPMGAIKRLTKYQKGIVSTLYICFRFKDEVDKTFFEQYFEAGKQNSEIEKFAQEGARNHGLLNIGINDFFCVNLTIPTLPEQQKIAAFLTAVDEKIQQLNKKKDLLEQYKKGVMQKIFNQETRFNDDNGNDFADWEEKPLGEIGKTYNGLTGKTKENFGVGKPFVTYKQIFDNSKIDVSKFALVEITEKDNQNLVQYGDVFFTVSSETPNEIGFASVLLNLIDELYLNSFCFGYRANSLEELKPEFSRYLFRSPNFRKEIVKLAQGSTRYNMSKIQLMKLKILLPSANEQTKIAAFLSAIDDKINLVNQELEKTQIYKKGLLQQMFI
jgi:type I restriction enzyme S subunit